MCHQTVTLAGIPSHVSLLEIEISREVAKFLGPRSSRSPIYQRFCLNPHKNRNAHSHDSNTRVLSQRKRHLKRDERPTRDRSLSLEEGRRRRRSQTPKTAKPAEPFFCLRRLPVIGYLRVRGMLMEITNINAGLKAPNVDPGSGSAKRPWGSVVGHRLCISIFALFFSPSVSLFFSSSLFLCSWPTLVFSFQLHQPCLLGVIANSPLLFLPPLPPPPPPHPVSQLILVSVMEHIWERLSCSESVCWSPARKRGVPNFASRSVSRLLWGDPPPPTRWSRGRHPSTSTPLHTHTYIHPVTDACAQEG